MAVAKCAVEKVGGHYMTDLAMYSQPVVVNTKPSAVFATDEEAREASAWVMANYKDAFMELARYDTN